MRIQRRSFFSAPAGAFSASYLIEHLPSTLVCETPTTNADQGTAALASRNPPAASGNMGNEFESLTSTKRIPSPPKYFFGTGENSRD